MVLLAAALDVLKGGRDLQVRIAYPLAVPGLYGVSYHLQILAGVIGIDACRLGRMSLDILRSLDMDLDYLLYQIRLIADQIAADHQAAAGVVGPHLSRGHLRSPLIRHLDYSRGGMGQEHSVNLA